MISEAIALARSRCGDDISPYQYDDSKMKDWFRQACFDAEKMLGTPSLDRITFIFDPYNPDDVSLIDESLYENYENITIDKYLKLTDTGKEGFIETKSIQETNQLAMIKIYANAIDGSIDDDVSFDISLDKPNTEETNTGTWILADGLVSEIKNGVYVLTDTIISRYFALKINIPSGKNIKIVDLAIERFHIIEGIDARINDLAKLMASYAFLNKAMIAIKDGNSQETIDSLFFEAKILKNEVLNIDEGEAIKSNAGGKISHYEGKNPYANKVFGNDNSIVQGFKDGDIITVRTDGVIRRVG